MNIHPIFVHFPIALLTLYSLFELFRFKKLNNETWTWVKTILLVLGTLGAFAALATGDQAKVFHRDVRRLVSTHEFYAQLTTLIYSGLSVNYLVLTLNGLLSGRQVIPPFERLWKLILDIRQGIFRPWVLIVFSLLGLAALLITGALGGLIAYGTTADPITKFLVNLVY